MYPLIQFLFHFQMVQLRLPAKQPDWAKALHDLSRRAVNYLESLNLQSVRGDLGLAPIEIAVIVPTQNVAVRIFLDVADQELKFGTSGRAIVVRLTGLLRGGAFSHLFPSAPTVQEALQNAQSWRRRYPSRRPTARELVLAAWKFASGKAVHAGTLFSAVDRERRRKPDSG
jgi:hypothetical protein